MLALAELGFLRGMPADGGQVEEDLRAVKRSEARGFRVPLVPANADADFGVAGLP